MKVIVRKMSMLLQRTKIMVRFHAQPPAEAMRASLTFFCAEPLKHLLS